MFLIIYVVGPYAVFIVENVDQRTKCRVMMTAYYGMWDDCEFTKGVCMLKAPPMRSPRGACRGLNTMSCTYGHTVWSYGYRSLMTQDIGPSCRVFLTI